MNADAFDERHPRIVLGGARIFEIVYGARGLLLRLKELRLRGESPPLATTDRSQLDRPALRRMRLIYRKYFDSKLFLKAKTPLGKLLVTRDLSWL